MRLQLKLFETVPKTRMVWPLWSLKMEQSENINEIIWNKNIIS